MTNFNQNFQSHGIDGKPARRLVYKRYLICLEKIYEQKQLAFDQLKTDGGNAELIKYMETKLYVGNLSYDVTENDLQDAFSQHGPVSEAKVIMDRDTGRPRGFAFVTMGTKEGAEAAIKALNGTDWHGRALTVNEARAREDGPSRGGGGGGHRGGGGRGGGGGRRY